MKNLAYSLNSRGYEGMQRGIMSYRFVRLYIAITMVMAFSNLTAMERAFEKPSSTNSASLPSTTLHICHLPADVLSQIFSQLTTVESIRSFLTLCRTCRGFNNLIQSRFTTKKLITALLEGIRKSSPVIQDPQLLVEPASQENRVPGPILGSNENNLNIKATDGHPHDENEERPPWLAFPTGYPEEQKVIMLPFIYQAYAFAKLRTQKALQLYRELLETNPRAKEALNLFIWDRYLEDNLLLKPSRIFRETCSIFHFLLAAGYDMFEMPLLGYPPIQCFPLISCAYVDFAKTFIETDNWQPELVLTLRKNASNPNIEMYKFAFHSVLELDVPEGEVYQNRKNEVLKYLKAFEPI